MKTSLLTLSCACFLSGVVFAEGKTLQTEQHASGVVLHCEFENDRTVKLLSLDDRVVWHENGKEYPASTWAHIRITGDPILSVFAYGIGIGSPRLDMYQGVTHAEKPNYEPGTAVLSNTQVGRDKLLIGTVEGFCQSEQIK
ncbi:MAG: hypothetical protein AB3N19_11610 [Ruegeria sp.]